MMEEYEMRFKEETNLHEIDLSQYIIPKSNETQQQFTKDKKDKWGFVPTPLHLVDSMIDSVIDSITPKSITCDACAGYGQFTIRLMRKLVTRFPNIDIQRWLENNHTFTELDEDNIRHLKNIFGNGIRILDGDTRNISKDEQFDVVLTNPPYNKDLHLKILNELVNVSDRVVCVHPARWIEDVLAQYKAKSATGKKYEHLKKMLTKVKMIKQKDGCQMFNIGLPQDMMIGVYENDKDNGGVLPIYEDSNMFFDVLGKILNYAHNVKSLGNVSEEDKIDGIRVEIKEIASVNMNCDSEFRRFEPIGIIGKCVIDNGFGPDGIWWSISGKQRKTCYMKPEGTPIPHSIKFDTTIDAQDFIDLYRTNVVKNIIHMLKYNQNAGHTHIPYFDPKAINTEDDVLDALGITNETHRQWMKRDVYDYREKDFIKYGEWIDTTTNDITDIGN